jgi:subtilisin family serine protease
MKFNHSLRHAIAIPLMVATLPLFSQLASAAPVPPEFVEILVKPKARMPEASLDSMCRARGAKQRGVVAPLGLRIIRAPKATAPQLLASLQHNSDVEYAEPDHTAYALNTANDPFFTQGSQWHLTKIQAPSAWSITTGSANVMVAVVDSGVNASHPDLAGRVLPGYDFVANDTDASDENGHGTGVAGVISPSTNNGVGVAGVSWNTTILPVRVLDASGAGSYSAIANGIIYAADRGAKVINLSLGGTASSRVLQDAVNYAWSKQAVLVAAAGNNGNSILVYPAACANVVAVAATNSSDVRPTWSNFGSYVDVAAPGANIFSVSGTSQYASWNGTSFASPVAAGVVALAASVNPQLTNTQLVDNLITNSDDIGVIGFDTFYGNGRVNAFRSVSAARPVVNADAIAPVSRITSPSNDAGVSSTQRINVRSTDNVGVTRVELYINGVLFGTRSFSPTTSTNTAFSWSTSRLPQGSYTLQSFSYDAASNVGRSAIITVKK